MFFVGILIDATGGYKVPFGVAAAALGLSFLLFYIVLWLQRSTTKKNEQIKEKDQEMSVKILGQNDNDIVKVN